MGKPLRASGVVPCRARAQVCIPAGSQQVCHGDVLHQVRIETSASAPGVRGVSKSMSLQGRTAADKRSSTRSQARASTGQTGACSPPYAAEHDVGRLGEASVLEPRRISGVRREVECEPVPLKPVRVRHPMERSTMRAVAGRHRRFQDSGKV